MAQLSDRRAADLIRLGQAQTQADLCRITGLNSSTVSDVLRRLRERGLIHEAGRRARGRGKPATLLRFGPGGYLAGIDIDGIHVVAALLDFDGNVLASETVGLAVRDSSPAHVMALAADTLTKLRRRRRIRLDAIHATAVTLNARLDDAGRVLYSSVLPWQGVAPAPLLTDAVPHPVFIAGGQYRAVAEQRLGAGRGARSMLYFHVGDGVSARLVVRGDLVDSRAGLHSEIGHLVFEPDGPTCGCGQRGCLEALLAGPAICRRIVADRATASPGPDDALFVHASRNASIAVMDVLVRHAADDTDGYAARLLDELTALAGRALATAAACNAPEHVVVGGYVFGPRPELVARIAQQARRHLGLDAALLPDVVPQELGDRARTLAWVTLATDGLARTAGPHRQRN